MTPTQEAAMRQALEAMSSFESGSNGLFEGEFVEEIAALKAALAEHFCDNHCTWLDHAPGCVRAEPDDDALTAAYMLGRHDGKRKPLTDEEILKAIGWDRAEMYMKLTPNFPVAEAKKETLKNARAIERAHGIT